LIVDRPEIEGAAPSTSQAPPRPLLLLGLVTAAWLSLFLSRILSPSDFAAYDQPRVAAYVMDIVQNGNWICQRDFRGEVTSKPPMYAWLASVSTLAFGRIGRFTLCFPSWFGMLLLSWLVLAVGSKFLGRGAGFWGAIGCLLSASGFKQVLLARTDLLFGLAVFVTLALGHRAWIRGRGWAGFWLSAAMTVLTKGPLGLLLAGAGVLGAYLWERRGGTGLSLRGSHALGLVGFVAITAGWLALAVKSLGGGVFEKIIGEELVGQTVVGKRGAFPGRGFHVPSISFLAAFLPWSLAACAGFWRVAKHPSTAPETRRFERVLFSYFCAGILVLSLAAHQRRDLVFPLLPAAGLLGGREIATRTRRRSPRAFRATLFGIPAGMLALLLSYQIVWFNRSEGVEKTRSAREFAARIEVAVGRAFPLSYVKTPFAVQFYLGTFRRNVSAERAARLLERSETAFVVVQESSLGADGRDRPETVAGHEVLASPEGRPPLLRVLGNHPRLEATPTVAMASGDLDLRLEHLRLTEDSEEAFVVVPSGGEYTFHVTNEGPEPRSVAVEVVSARSRGRAQRVLRPGETWSARGISESPQLPWDPRDRPAWRVVTVSAFLAVTLCIAGFFAVRTRRAVAEVESW
jgi:4-amino-4-deoxy-L-arabinose transferase-like glycosyltransferase